MKDQEVIVIKKYIIIPLILTLFSITILIQPVIAYTLPNIEIIVDDPEATFIGDWHVRTRTTIYQRFYGDEFHYNFAGDGTDTFTWTFDLPYSGQWEVSAMWANGSNRATDSPYTIKHAEGIDIVRVNQEVDGAQWNTLGTYTFDKGETTVTLSDDADQAVIADAIKFVYRTAPSLREQKELAIDILDQIEIEDKKVEHRIDKMIDNIEKSLDDKLWADENTPNSNHGNKIFDNEKKAVEQGTKIIKDKHTTEEVNDNIVETINNLISADRQLAENTYEQASLNSGDKKVDHELEKAEKCLEKANEELNKISKNGKKGPKYHKVIDQLKKSWKHSQKALKHAEKLDQ